MKNLLLSFLLICTSTFSQALPKEPTWVFVPEASLNGAKSYFDMNGIDKKVVKGTKYSIGTILIVPNEKVLTTLPGGGKILAASMVRHLIVDCDNELTTNLYDLYFDVMFPKRNTKSLGGVDYTKTKEYSSLSKTSPLYLIMCPTEI